MQLWILSIVVFAKRDQNQKITFSFLRLINMTDSTKKTTTTTKRRPYRSQLVSRGDVSHARDTDEVQGIVTDETTQAADQKELEALGTILIRSFRNDSEG